MLSSLTSLPTSDHNLSRLMMGWKYWFFLMLKCLIPTCISQWIRLVCLLTYPKDYHSGKNMRDNTHLSKVTRMVLVEHDPVVMLATSITPSTRMLSVLSDTAMASTDVTTLLPVLPQACITQTLVNKERQQSLRSCDVFSLRRRLPPNPFKSGIHQRQQKQNVAIRAICCSTRFLGRSVHQAQSCASLSM